MCLFLCEPTMRTFSKELYHLILSFLLHISWTQLDDALQSEEAQLKLGFLKEKLRIIFICYLKHVIYSHCSYSEDSFCEPAEPTTSDMPVKVLLFVTTVDRRV